MKKTLILAMALSFFAISISAQKVYEVQKIGTDTILTPKDAKAENLGQLVCSDDLMQKYGSKIILDAWRSGKLEIFHTSYAEYSRWGNYKRMVSKKVFLIKKADTIIRSEEPIDGPWALYLGTVILWIISIISGIFITKGWQTAASVGEVTCFFLGMVGIFLNVIVFSTVVSCGQWLPAIVTIILFSIGLLLGYLHKKRKAKKLTAIK